MRNFWLKFGCFLTGYNYKILKSCSEASVKSLKKYTSALIIVMFLWAFVGYAFSKEYLRLDKFYSGIVAFIMVIIVLQIERQVILTVGKNNFSLGFRIVIAVIMAILGAVIVDQIIFKEDIEKRKLLNIDAEVNKLLPAKLEQINIQIAELDTAIMKKEKERSDLLEEITKNPSIQMPTYTTKKVPSKVKKQTIVNGNLVTIEVDTVLTEKVYVSKAEQNPKAQFIPQIDEQIESLRTQREKLFSQKRTIRDDLEKELKGKVAFLDELNVMIDIMLSSVASFVFWILWFIFFFAIELFVIVSKRGDEEDDYNRIIRHQLNIRLSSIEELNKSISKS